MKLTELAMAIDKKISHSEQEIKQAEEQILNGGKLLQSIEGNKYKLIINDEAIGLFTNDDVFIGFLLFKNVDDSIVSLEKIFIVPEFRNLKMAKIFLYWFKMSFKKAVFVGGAIFSDGQNFIKSIAKDPRFQDDIIGFNIKSKERFKFDVEQYFDHNQNTGFLFEQNDDFYGMYDNRLPGQPKGVYLICLEMFANEA